jgi:hypothetical protein
MGRTNAVDTANSEVQVVEGIVYSARANGKDSEIDFGDSTYQQKAQLLNSAIEEIGMGNINGMHYHG